MGHGVQHDVDANAVRIGRVVEEIFGVFAFATDGWMLYAGILPFAIVGIAQPAIRSMMANKVPAEAQGELQGATSSLMSLTMIVSPLFMTELFREFSREGAPIDFPGAPFFAASLLSLLALAIFVFATRAPDGGRA